MSARISTNSTRAAGTSASTRARTDAMMSSAWRRFPEWSRTAKSPRFVVGTAVGLRSAPVRREKDSISGVSRRIASIFSAARFVSVNEVPAGVL